jgi:hypothetical protein
LTAELLLFDAAQNTDPQQPWRVSFCPICNSGAAFVPKVGAQTLTFSAGGIYNAMAILRDMETGSYWNHIHGTCVHGPMHGQKLERITTMRHMRPKPALTAYPDLQLALASLTPELCEIMPDEDEFRRAERPDWSARLNGTWVDQDTRLPRYDMGLGVWSKKSACYWCI